MTNAIKVLLFLFLILYSFSHADCQTTYSRLAEGDFLDASLWSPFNPPTQLGPGGPTDTVEFDRGFLETAPYTVFGVLGSNGRLVVQNDSVLFEFDNYALLNPDSNETASLIVGENTGDNAFAELSGPPGSQLDAQSVNLGSVLGAMGTVVVRDSDLAWNNSGFIRIGNRGSGSLQITDGSTVSSQGADVGLFADSNGSVIVDGRDSLFSLATVFRVGNFGTGDLTVSNGATLEVGSQAGSLLIGANQTSDGRALVSGDGTTVNVGLDIFVGDRGIACLEVENGALVTCKRNFGIANIIATSCGEVALSGEGTRLEVGKDLAIAVDGIDNDTGTGTMTIQGGAELVVAEDLFVEDFIFGTLNRGFLTVRGSGSTVNCGRFWGRGVTVVENGASILSAGECRLQSGSITTIDGEESSLDVIGLLLVGQATTAVLNIRNGASVCAERVKISRMGAMGEANVTGIGSSLVSEGEMVVGDVGPQVGILMIQDGGVVHSGHSSIALETGAAGEVVVEDHGSEWIIEGDLTMGGFVGNELNFADGSLAIRSEVSVSISGDTDVYSLACIDLDGGELTTNTIRFLDGEILGNGTFEFTGGTLHVGTYEEDLENMGGTLAPGSPSVRFGTTNISGNYSQDSNSALEIEIGGTASGTNHDFFQVDGDASLDGMLEIQLAETYLPMASDTFTIANVGGGINGNFINVVDNERLDTLNGSGSFLVRYGNASPNPNQIVLSSFQPNDKVLLGDVNMDGVVNLLDVAHFVDAVANNTFIPEADINGDGEVNLLDVADFVAILSGPSN